MTPRTVRSWKQGKSVAITIPYEICKELRITNGSVLKAENIDGKIVYTPLLIDDEDEKIVKK